MKINRRLINISIICLIAALILTYFVYNAAKKASEPEPTKSVVYFKKALDKDTIVKAIDCEVVQTPISLVPKNAIDSIDKVKDKRLLVKVDEGDWVLSNKIGERGDPNPEVQGMWTIGIDVVNISNYLGCDIKTGKDYVLLYKDPNFDTKILSVVRVANMLDATGKQVAQNSDVVVKTINISVENEEDVKRIAKAKEIGKFDLVKSPEGKEVKAENFEIFKPQNTNIINNAQK